MPKFPTFPTLYDSVLQINISTLKEWNYLIPGQCINGAITWSRNGHKTGSINIAVNMQSDCPYIELSYKHRDIPVNYKVHLVSINSNIGKGKIWYFQCPQTGKHCRKLYSVGKKFLHREAFNGCMYESQTQSHKSRNLDKFCEKVFGGNKASQQIYSKHFKKYYAGKPTKRYKRLWKKVMTGSNVTQEQIKRMLF